MAVFNNRAGNQTFRGRDGVYDQVDYAGQISDYTFTQLANGNVRVTHPTLGIDTLISVEGFWFSGEARWYSLSDALALSSDNGFLDANGVRQGTDRNDTQSGDNGDDFFYGGLGNDSFSGAGGYNQVNYDGSLLEYRVTENANGSVTFSHASWGDDVLTDIDGLWFAREARWYSMEDAIDAASGNSGFILDEDGVLNGTSGNDVMRGNSNQSDYFYGGTGNDVMDGNNGRAGAAYDQVNYDGAVADYTFTLLANGSIRAEHPIWGRDTLIDIEGIWFNGDAVWRSTDSLVSGAAGSNKVSTASVAPARFDTEMNVDAISALLLSSDSGADPEGYLTQIDDFGIADPMDHIVYPDFDLF